MPGDDVAGHRAEVAAELAPGDQQHRAHGGFSVAAGLSLVSLQEDRLQARRAAIDAQQVDAVLDQRAHHLGTQVGRALQRDQRDAVRLAHARCASPMPVTVRATSIARADGPATSTSMVPASPPSCVGQLLLGPLGDDLAALDDQQAVAGLADLGEDVAGEQDRVLAAQRADGGAHLDDLHRVEAAGRLVEDQQLRLVHQRLGDADALAVAVRQAEDRLRRARRESRSSPRPRSTALAASDAGTPRSSAAKAGSGRPSSRRRAAACRAGSRCGAGPRAGRARRRCRRR